MNSRKNQDFTHSNLSDEKNLKLTFHIETNISILKKLNSKIFLGSRKLAKISSNRSLQNRSPRDKGPCKNSSL